MTRRLQNRVAESRWALPATMAYALAVWLAAGLVQQGWWLQAGCMVVTSYLVLQLNNVHALIRIYSRMVTCSYVVMSCAASCLFPSVAGAVVQLLMTAMLLVLLLAYQHKEAAGTVYYAFLLMGLASTLTVHLLYLVPVVWLLMMFYLQCLSPRTWVGSLLGLLTPYWFYGCWLLCRQAAVLPGLTPGRQDARLTDLADHFAPLLDVDAAPAWPLQSQLLLLLVVAAAIVGSIHFARQSSGDKIRVRMCFACFFWLDAACLVLLLLLPQHFDWLVRLMVVSTAPLTGHFIALSHSRLSNALFVVLAAATLALTVFNLLA